MLLFLERDWTAAASLPGVGRMATQGLRTEITLISDLSSLGCRERIINHRMLDVGLAMAGV
jgi:hypothetical protein